MSFDVFLVTFRDGSNAQADRRAARAVLDSFDFAHDPESSCYEINFNDGTHLEMYTAGLHDDNQDFSTAMFALRGLSDEIAEFMYEFSKAAGSVMFPAMEPPCVLIPREDLVAHLPQDLADECARIPIADAKELHAALIGGYDSWRAFRDQVIADQRPSDEG
ncbi:MAG TPA: hypothetical protein EYP56_00535 [Planctomycetaceae bacterium]|nr:hypothetical protein [Planctomycetaceae bacterium]